MPTTGSQPIGPNLPSFDDGKNYILKGSSLNAIVAAIKCNRVKVVEGGGLKVVEITEDGTFLAVDGINCNTAV